jgi:hypothetical protein
MGTLSVGDNATMKLILSGIPQLTMPGLSKQMRTTEASAAALRGTTSAMHVTAFGTAFSLVIRYV